MGTEFAEPEKRPVKKPEGTVPQPLALPQSSPPASPALPQATRPTQRVIPDPNRPGQFMFEPRQQGAGANERDPSKPQKPRVIPDPNRPGQFMFEERQRTTGATTFDPSKPQGRRMVPDPNNPGGYIFQTGAPGSKKTAPQQAEPKTTQPESMQLASAKLDPEQAQTQPQSGVSSEGAKVASGRQMRPDPGEVDPNYRERRPPAEINRLFPEVKFQADVAARAQSLLKANKDRLNREQQQYTQDKNPKSERWQHLWKVAAQRRSFETQERVLKEQREKVVDEITHTSNYANWTGLTGEQVRQTDAYKKSVKLAAQKKQLDAQIQQARQMQISLNYAYPALAAIKGETGENPQDIQKVQGRLPQTFNETRGDIDKLSKALTDDPSKAWLFDSVVATQLKDKSLNPQQRQQLVQRIEKEHRDAAGGLMLGGLLSGGLFAASLSKLKPNQVEQFAEATKLQIEEKMFQAELVTVRKLGEATTTTVVNENGSYKPPEEDV